MAIDVSIAINSYKNTELLRLCIESIKRNVKNVSFEVIVVDGETEESTAMMMREDFPDVRFFSFSENVGFPRLVEKGLEMSRGTCALLLNSDIIVTPGVVEKLCAFLKDHPDVGMVGPKLLGFNEEFQASCFRFYKPETILYRRTFLGRFGFAKKHIDWFLMKEYDHAEPREVDWLMGSAMMVPMTAVRKVGYMDHRFFMYMEDVDWCRRFWENGYRVVYYPHAQMYHYHGKGSAKGGVLYALLFNKLIWYHIASAIKYFKKYRGKPLPSPQSNNDTHMKLSQKIFPLIIVIALMGASFWAGFERGLSSRAVLSDLSVSSDGVVVSPQGAFINNKDRKDSIDFNLFWKAWDLLKEKYVDKGKLDANEMMYGAIKGMLASTGDPYTTFFDPKANKEFQEEITGSFQGIGAEIGIKDDVLTIVAPLDDSPAQKAGLLAGDKILKIDGTSTSDMDVEKAVTLIRGVKDTEVKLTIFRSGDDETKEIAVKRDVISVKSVKTEFKDDGIAVIKVSRFGDEENKETTADLFRRAIDDAVAKKSRGLIIDLRNNPGGYLDVAVDMASLMLPSNKVVVMEENSNGDRKKMFSRGGDLVSGVETVVLINEGSASASEILSGALRDNRTNVTLIGKKSYGKGSVQELVPVTKDTSVKITVARWLTPNGKQINHEGIAPDAEVSITADDRKAEKDPQLDKAIEILKEKLR